MALTGAAAASVIQRPIVAPPRNVTSSARSPRQSIASSTSAVLTLAHRAPATWTTPRRPPCAPVLRPCGAHRQARGAHRARSLEEPHPARWRGLAGVRSRVRGPRREPRRAEAHRSLRSGLGGVRPTMPWQRLAFGRGACPERGIARHGRAAPQAHGRSPFVIRTRTNGLHWPCSTSGGLPRQKGRAPRRSPP